MGGMLAIVTTVVLLTDFLPSNQVVLSPGDVSSDDILAPDDLTFESEIRTRQAQDAQENSVQDIFDPPDASIARQQELRALQILGYISSVRQDAYASPEDQVDWIAAIPDLSMSPEIIDRMLAMNVEQWQQVEAEVPRVLVRAMQGEIKESQLDSLRRRIPTLIGHGLTDTQADLVKALTRNLVTANTFYNAARTEEARQQARDDTPPVSVTIRQGEAIVRAGDLVRPVDIEALEAYGLWQQDPRWQSILGTIAFALLASTVLGLFIYRFHPALWAQARASVVTFLLITLFVIVSKLMLPVSESIVPYLYPLPALSMILTVLFGPIFGIVVGATVGLIGVFVAGGSLELTVYLIAGTFVGALVLGKAEDVKSFLQAGLAVALTNAAVILLFGLLSPDQDMLKAAIGALVGIVMGALAASLTLAAFFALSALLDVTTPFQLMELSRPTHPLFRRLLLRAPGTYHHTLLVSNMAEQAAHQIGADGLLARVGTYYHDVGKTVRPYFFTENRVGSENPHKNMDPRTSASIIISHVQDGLDLAEQYNLPSAVRAFIPEHHGTSLVLAFYRMAVSAAADGDEEVQEEDFRYPGPKPQTKETAILMLADGCEARVRSAEPESAEEIERLIHEMVKARLDSGQLDESDLTLHDLQVVQASFLNVLQGVFHPRVKYPEPVTVKDPDGQQTVR
jgi:putative nucleotidyltransferase with HDIG domain